MPCEPRSDVAIQKLCDLSDSEAVCGLGSTKSDSPPLNSSCVLRAADASLSLECVGLHSGQSFSGSAGSAAPFADAQGLSDTSRSD